MKKLIALLFVMAALMVPLQAATRLRAVTWNIHHGEDANGVLKPATQATFLATLQPDVVALQEVEQFTGYGNSNQVNTFKNALQAATHVTWYAHFVGHSGRVDATGTQGIAILSRFPFINRIGKSIYGGRGVALASVKVGTRTLSLTSLHLKADGDTVSQRTRVTQTADITCAIENFGIVDRIIMGDFNGTNNVLEIAPFFIWYRDMAPNIGGTHGSSRIDYIFFGKMVRSFMVFQSAKKTTTTLSDHLPVTVEWQVN